MVSAKISWKWTYYECNW